MLQIVSNRLSRSPVHRQRESRLHINRRNGSGQRRHEDQGEVATVFVGGTNEVTLDGCAVRVFGVCCHIRHDGSPVGFVNFPRQVEAYKRERYYALQGP